MSENSLKTLDFVLALCYTMHVTKDEGRASSKKGDKVTLSKEEWNYQFYEIEKWLSLKDYLVLQETDGDDSIVWETKIVYVNSRSHPETRYYTLLHECGHLLVAQGAEQWSKDVPMYATVEDGRVMSGRAYGVSLVAEEIEAWKRGRRLAKRFDHYIDDKKYDNLFTQCVFSYIESVAEEF